MDDSASPVPPTPSATSEASEKKKRDKVRSAWISFVGRIVAQVVGAVASITLALFFLQRTQAPNAQPTPADEPRALAGERTPARSDGLTTLAVLHSRTIRGRLTRTTSPME
jgi:hypothetical protein